MNEHCQVTCADDIEHFRRRGWFRARKRICPDVLEPVRAHVARLFAQPTDGAARGFAGLKYDVDHPSVTALREHPSVRELLYACANFVPVCTQAIAFEVTAEAQGFPWHIDTLSNNFIMPQDKACTLWIPLSPVDRKGQDGGMRWVGSDVWKGDYGNLRRRYLAPRERWDAIVAAEREASEVGREPINGRHANYYGLTKAQSMLLDELGESCDFDVGDCLLFSKFVYHRSAALRAGPLRSRRTLALRFVDFDARYSKLVCEGTNVTYKLESDYGLRFSALEDGERLRKSPHFPRPF